MSGLGPGNARNYGGSGREAPRRFEAEASQTGQPHAGVGIRHMGVNPSDAARSEMFKDERYFPYFGLANAPLPPRNSYDEVAQEYYILPDAYKGSNRFMRNIIIDQIQATQMWGTSIAMPWKLWEGGNQIDWDSWIFNHTQLTRTPHEAVSRMMSSHFYSQRAYTVRFGIAMIMEHGFWNTAMGKEHYALQLVQMRNAICTTAQHGVIVALLHPPKYIDPNERYRVQGVKGRDGIKKFFKWEFREWAVLNKDPDGWVNELELLDTELKARNQTTGDLIIVPSGSKKFVNDSVTNKYHFLSGGMYKNIDHSSLQAGGRMVIESNPVQLGENRADYDPCYRERCIGTYFKMFDHHLQHIDLKERKTSMLDTIIFSELLDDFYKVSYKVAVKTTGLYTGWEDARNVGDMPITTLGTEVFPPGVTWGECYKNAERLDDFLKQLKLKGEGVYNNFLEKFVIENEEKAQEARAPRRGYEENELDNDEQKSPKDQVYAEAGDWDSLNKSPLDKFKRVDLSYNYVGKISSLLHYFNQLDTKLKDKLDRLDKTTRKRMNIEGIEQQLQQHITHLIDSFEKPYTEDKLGVVFELCQGFAGGLLISYALAYSAVQKFMNNSATQEELHMLHLSAANPTKHQSPIWVTNPEFAKQRIRVPSHSTAAGDAGNGTTHELSEQWHAFTIGTNYVVLFDRATKESIKSNCINLNDTSKEVSQRLPMLQLNAELSMLYTDIVENELHGAELLVSWREAIPRTDFSGRAIISDHWNEYMKLDILEYQSPLRTIIELLRRILHKVYTIKESPSDAELQEFEIMIKECDTAIWSIDVNDTLVSWEIATSHGQASVRGAGDDKATEAAMKEIQTAYKKIYPSSLEDRNARKGKLTEERYWIPELIKIHGTEGIDKELFQEIVKDVDLFIHGDAINSPSDGDMANIGTALGFDNITDDIAIAEKLTEELNRDKDKLNGEALVSILLTLFKTEAIKEKILQLRRDKAPFAIRDIALVYRYHLMGENFRRRKTTQEFLAHAQMTHKNAYGQQAMGGADGGGNDDHHLPIVTENKHTFIMDDVIRQHMMESMSMKDGYFWKWCIENDMIVAIGMIGEKPYCRYDMGTMIIMSAYGKTGYTFMGRADMMLSDDAALKRHYGHLTLDMKSVVLDERRLIHGRDIVCREYLGGNDHLIWDASDPADKEDFDSGNLHKSIFMVPMLMNTKIETTHRDITGHYPAELMADAQAAKDTENKVSEIYANYWGWRNTINSLNNYKFSNDTQVMNGNTIVWQEHQFLYNHGSKKWDIVIIHAGHWGNRIYSGCSADRTGQGTRYLKPCKWDNTATVALIA